MKFIMLVDPSLVNIYLLGLSDQSLGLEKKIFKEIHQFYTFYPKITSPWGRRPWILQFLISLPYRCYIPNLVKIDPVVLEKKMLTHRWKPTCSNKSPEWLRWPKNPLSLFLKIEWSLFVWPCVPWVSLNKFEFPLPKDALCYVWLKLAQQFWRGRFLNFINVFLLFRNYLPFANSGSWEDFQILSMYFCYFVIIST